MPPMLTHLQTKRDEILRLVAQYGASNVRVVGSVARGDTTENSDVDLLMTISPKPSVFDLVELWQHLQDLIGYPVSIIPDDTSNKFFMESILEDAIPL
ncbi:MAG: nucleotidyltransferase domain-containing protein [bacterium]|nr:nucleotidyltransferase domain-containing protein [bacterium]